MNPKLQALYGLKFHPFREAPTEALLATPSMDAVCKRVGFSLDVGLAIVAGDPNSGKLAALRTLAAHLSKHSDPQAGEDTP